MKRNKFAPACVGLVSSFLVLAISPIASAWYVEGNVGYGKVNSDLDYWSTDNTGTAESLNIGYEFNQNFALEAGFANFSDTSADYLGDLNTENYYFDVAAKGILPLAKGFQLFGKLGIAEAHTKWANYIYGDTQGNGYTRTVGLVGGGVSYNVTDHFAITAQYVTTSKSGDEVPEMEMTSIGLAYKF